MNHLPDTDQHNKLQSFHFVFIWLLNSLLTFLGLFFFFITDMSTREFLDEEGLMLLALIALMGSAPIVVVETAVFFLTKKILTKKEFSRFTAQCWLCGPSWAFALILTASALWNITPQKRLTKVCGGTAIKAQDIRVAGCTGLQMGEWLAIFETKPDEFQKLINGQKMETSSPANFSEILSHVAMIKHSTLFNQLPSSFNSPCFKREVTGVDGRIHGGIYATFNSTNSRAIVFRTGY